ncbi:ribonuclease HI family protein [Rothia sp. LK2588]|uniref:ribonuclease HI family protein n=1 Tax=Rothia sp. LK2588 TaxID=3114369 RepID=UPI0034CD5E8B
MSTTEPIIAAADGSALGNPGPAGWAWFIDENTWASGGWKRGTNNMGELQAVLSLFEATAHVPERELRIFCDSKYTIDSITKWMPGWKKKGWKKSDGKPVLNLELMQALDAALVGRNYTFTWVKGHAGHEMNERADELARAAATAYKNGTTPDAGPGFSATGGAGGSGADKKPAAPTTIQTTAQTGAPTTVQKPETAQPGADQSNPKQPGPKQPGPEQLEARLNDPAFTAEAANLEPLLASGFEWITPAGRTVDRATVIELRAKAFAVNGTPKVLRVEAGASHAAVLSEVPLERGAVLRTSVWSTANRRGTWQLTLRQETATGR